MAKRVVILGGGFAGVQAAVEIEQRRGRRGDSAGQRAKLFCSLRRYCLKSLPAISIRATLCRLCAIFAGGDDSVFVAM